MTLPARILAYALALVFAVAGWWLYAQERRARIAEHAAAEAVSDLQRETNRGRARTAAAEFRASRASQTARSTQYATRLAAALQRPIPCPPAASAPAPGLADVVVPADAVRVLHDAAGTGQD